MPVLLEQPDQQLDSGVFVADTIFIHPKASLKGAGKTKVIDQSRGFNRLLIGGCIFGMLISLAALVVKLKTKDGTLIVTVNEPDAEVQVLSDDGKVEITRIGENGPITISVEPGKHRVKVGKDGFEFFAESVEIKSGEKQSITAELIPLDDKPPMAETKPAPVFGEKRTLAFEKPGFDQWVKEVATQTAEDQLTAVAKMLQELNPGFDGKIGHQKIDGDVVTELRINTEKVNDISPVRVFSGLKSLQIYGERVTGILSDLSPLNGMPLTTLYCYRTQVADLSPLKEMPLVNFNCSATKVTDLSPLNGMHLAALTCSNNPQISDISVIKGMPLKALSLHNTKIPDLSLLKELPLTFVDCDLKTERDAEILHSIKTLERINGKPAEEYFKELEAK